MRRIALLTILPLLAISVGCSEWTSSSDGDGGRKLPPAPSYTISECFNKCGEGLMCNDKIGVCEAVQDCDPALASCPTSCEGVICGIFRICKLPAGQCELDTESVAKAYSTYPTYFRELCENNTLEELADKGWGESDIVDLCEKALKEAPELEETDVYIHDDAEDYNDDEDLDLQDNSTESQIPNVWISPGVISGDWLRHIFPPETQEAIVDLHDALTGTSPKSVTHIKIELTVQDATQNVLVLKPCTTESYCTYEYAMRPKAINLDRNQKFIQEYELREQMLLYPEYFHSLKFSLRWTSSIMDIFKSTHIKLYIKLHGEESYKKILDKDMLIELEPNHESGAYVITHDLSFNPQSDGE